MQSPSWFFLAGLLTLGVPVQAQVQAAQVSEQRTSTAASSAAKIMLDENELLVAKIWDLTPEEMQRARLLASGPRHNFSVENLSPVEILGIHARNEAERRKYAEKFAKAFREDVERSLEWDRAFTEAMQRLYPNSPVVDYSGLPQIPATVGAADILNVPRKQIREITPAQSPTTARDNAPVPTRGGR